MQPESRGEIENDLVEFLAEVHQDPLRYVMGAWDWANDPTIQLVELPPEYQARFNCKHGPDVWAIKYLEDLGDQIKKNNFQPGDKAVDPVQMAVASGHGIGKSTLTAWVACFLMDTRPHSVGIVTANTGTQLATKTWAQIKKWRKKSLAAHWWTIGERQIRHIGDSDWGISAVTWKKHESEAFAGQHAAASSSYYLFDEASAIDNSIFEVSEGGLTDGEPFRLLFGNPTRNSGFFYDCFHKQRHRWITFQVDSRSCQITNKRLYHEWVEDFGEDSDFVRVRVKGQFPKASSRQLIGTDLIMSARAREIEEQEIDIPVIVGVDVARHGLAESVICIRRGMDARSIRWRVYRGLDNMQLASRVVEVYRELASTGMPPAMIFVDGGGNGSGVVDRLRQLGYPVGDILFGSKADRPDRYRNRVAEMWAKTRDWLKGGGTLPQDDEVLAEQLQNREYFYTAADALFLESKDDLEDRGLDSPDRADALALTFAYHVARVKPSGVRQPLRPEDQDYDPHANQPGNVDYDPHAALPLAA